MANVIVWTNASDDTHFNNGVIITVPGDSGLSLADIATKDLPPAKAYSIIDATTLPDYPDYYFQPAWDLDDITHAVTVDTARAKTKRVRDLKATAKTYLAYVDSKYQDAVDNSDAGTIATLGPKRISLRAVINEDTSGYPSVLTDLKIYEPAILSDTDVIPPASWNGP